jgi:hypothetical protein
MTDRNQLSPREAERAELETVVEALARSPRLSRLLRYLGDRYFAGETDQLHEYNIATEVFERSKTTFDASEDAIARVEAHRLRKRLKSYYENEGRGHSVQIWIPSGTYIPVFTRHPGEATAPVEAEIDLPATIQEETAATPAPPATSRSRWIFAAAALIALILAITAGIFWWRHSASNNAAASPAAAPAINPVPAQAAPGAPVRILCGYTGRPQMDSSGAQWEADRYNYGGGVWRRGGAPVARTSDQMLYDQWRTGDFFYNIPLPQGVYEVHLFFVTNTTAADAWATFTVRINDQPVLNGFDVNADALGDQIADEKVIRDVSPNKNGILTISFTSERGAPAVNAIEVLPGIPHKQLPIRILAQNAPYTDNAGRVWHPDTYYMNGRMAEQRRQVDGSPDPALFNSERYGHFTYAIPVDTRGRYTVILHFAEFYFGPHVSGVGGESSRVFRVLCNGNTLLDNFDIYKEAGGLHLLTRTFTHIRPSAQGKINLTFEPIQNNATVSGIEVIA